MSQRPDNQASPDSQNNGSSNGEPLSFPAAQTPRKRGFVIGWCILAIVSFIGFIALGTWQLERRVWKLALIERVESRVSAAPQATPPKSEWSNISATSHEYLHVTVQGQFLHADSTLVDANTNLGTGFWVLTPLRQADGNIVLINRGFIADKQSLAAANTGDQSVTLTGLLRISEPGGNRLRKNEPTQNRWFSRDVTAIAEARGLDKSSLAPYFIDVDYATSAPPTEPVGGLTIISFYNHHLIYALTWYALALMVAGATAYLLIQERKKSA